MPPAISIVRFFREGCYPSPTKSVYRETSQKLHEISHTALKTPRQALVVKWQLLCYNWDNPINLRKNI